MNQKNLYLALLILCFTPIVIWAQEQEKFGKISTALATQKTYSVDSSAHAFVAFDKGSYKIQYSSQKGFVCYINRHVRIKILDKSGLDLGSIEIPVSNNDRLFGIKAVTLNPGATNSAIQSIPFDNKTLIVEKVNEYYSKHKIAMPQVKEGSVIDLLYEQEISDINFIPTWVFQRKIPTQTSSLSFDIPEYFGYNKHLNGLLNLSEQKNEVTQENILLDDGSMVKYQEYHTTYSMSNVPAFRDEPFVYCDLDYLSMLDFELARIQLPFSHSKFRATTWEKLNQQLLLSDYFGAQLKPIDLVEAELNLLKNKFEDSLQYANLILNHVRNKIKWNNAYSVFSSEKLKKIYSQGNGNSADLNLLLYQYLKLAGYEVNPFLVSTLNHGRIKSFSPSLSKFNHVILQLYLNNKWNPIDACNKYSTVGSIPKHDRTNLGFMSGEGNGYLHELQNQRNRKTVVYNLTLETDGSLSGVVTNVYEQEVAMEKRAEYGDSSELKLREKLKSKVENLEIDELSITNLNELSQSLIEKAQIKIPNALEKSGNNYLLSPLLFDRLKENPFEEKTRTYPIQIPLTKQSIIKVFINVPENMQVGKLPENKYYSTPDKGFEYKYQATSNENTIQLQVDFKTNKNFFEVNEYSSLQGMFDKIIELENQYVLLNKKP
jgi:hypothetical protein